MTFYAHSGLPEDRATWQTLPDHSLQVAALAAEMGRPLGLETAAFFAGIFHDLGKYNPAFQRRIAGSGEAVDHSTAGAVHLPLLAQNLNDKMIAQIVAYAIAGHHAGLPDRLNETAACLCRRIEGWRDDLDPAWKTELPTEITGLMPDFAFRFQRDRAPFQLSVMGRMIFSCLVDADYKDTEAYYAALEGRQVDRLWPLLPDLLPGFIAAFDAYMAGMPKTATPLNRLRGDILSHVRGKAQEARGLFTLTVPTGGGKTLASLGFALNHAKAHGHTRIIYAIPFTSIIDQAAAIFRSVLGDDVVLEHHSAIDEEKFDPKQPRESRDKLKLAMEDWAAPVVVTTNVQLFESLFAARTSRARKLHNIANAVIILDEAQTIPRSLLLPAMAMLRELAENYGCSIVLCTATQPTLDENRLKGGLPLHGRELAPDPHGLASTLRRATIRLAPEPMHNDDLIAALEEAPQALVIVNSRKHALELYREAQTAGLSGLVHLTTRQYAVHRRQILDDVRARLKTEKPCRVIATSLVEAGVDVDFPRVWRAKTGLDSIIQAAGRCNREGKRPVEDSIVTVFTAPDYPPPSEIKGLVSDMGRMLEEFRDDLLSLAAIEKYFGEVYWRMGDKLDARKILACFPPLSSKGTDFSYRKAAEDFRMIESGMEPVIIAGDDVSQGWVAKLGIETISSGQIARKLQTYTVQVPPKARDLLIRNGHVSFIRPDLRGDQFAVLTNGSLYTEETGLLWENAEYLASESSIL
jgi:CRISPR-associated endonuclease/helicase Cas3